MANKIIAGVLVVLTLAVGYLFYASVFGPMMLGKASGPSHFQHESFLEGFSAGPRDAFSVARTGAVTLGAYAEGTCNLSQSQPGSHAATTSKEYYCAVTGVVAGDTVQIILPAGAGGYTSGAQSILGGFVANGAFASTSNRIGVNIVNLTGTASSSFIQATTSAHYLVWH